MADEEPPAAEPLTEREVYELLRDNALALAVRAFDVSQAAALLLEAPLPLPPLALAPPEPRPQLVLVVDNGGRDGEPRGG